MGIKKQPLLIKLVIDVDKKVRNKTKRSFLLMNLSIFSLLINKIIKEGKINTE